MFIRHNIGYPDKPQIFVIDGMDGAYIRPIGNFNGTNFAEIADEYKMKIDRGELRPWCYTWKCIYLNYLDPDWWLETRLSQFLQRGYRYYALGTA